MATGAAVVYVTAPDAAVAAMIGREVVLRRLAACANVLAGVRSIYRWQDAIQDEAEVILILKTTSARVPAVIEAVRALHPYTVPCITAWPLADGNPAFLDWIAGEVG